MTATPTPAANSYGTAADVAALTGTWTDDGEYTAATNPTLAIVVGWIDQVSALINTVLAAAGFAIPVTNADAKLALKSYVAQVVGDLCHAANSSGRFFTERILERGLSPMALIRREILDYITQNADGLAALGAARAGDTASAPPYSSCKRAQSSRSSGSDWTTLPGSAA